MAHSDDTKFTLRRWLTAGVAMPLMVLAVPASAVEAVPSDQAQISQTAEMQRGEGRRGGGEGRRGGGGQGGGSWEGRSGQGGGQSGGWQSRRGGDSGGWQGRRQQGTVQQPQAQPQVRAQQQVEPQQQQPRFERRGGDNGRFGERVIRDAQRSGGDRNWRGDDRRGENWRQAERRGAERRDAERRDDRRNYRNGYNNGYREGYRDERRYDNRRYGNYDRRWNNGWRNDRRYDWYGYRSYNRNIYRLPSYYAPYRGYRYSRVGVGFRLDSLFFGSRYLINDPWRYRLPEVYGSYRWVRYYDDVLLVDVYSGEVVDVIHNFFW